MTTLNKAMARMDAALTRLEAAFDAARPGEVGSDEAPGSAELQHERDKMADEIRALRARTDADARLREEAAEAVREALRDLRGAVDQGEPANA